MNKERSKKLNLWKINSTTNRTCSLGGDGETNFLLFVAFRGSTFWRFIGPQWYFFSEEIHSFLFCKSNTFLTSWLHQLHSCSLSVWISLWHCSHNLIIELTHLLDLHNTWDLKLIQQGRVKLQKTSLIVTIINACNLRLLIKLIKHPLQTQSEGQGLLTGPKQWFLCYIRHSGMAKKAPNKP